MRVIAVVAFGWLGLVSANAADFDPNGTCIIHIKKGEKLVMTKAVQLWIMGGGMRSDQVAWCIDDGAEIVYPKDWVGGNKF